MVRDFMKIKVYPRKILPLFLSYMLLTGIVSTITIAQQSNEKPNILWLVSEDNSPFIGAYGDDIATTPNIDKLAESGFLYTHAYANAPVCAPARNTIITGAYANSNGNQYMRSNYKIADIIEFFPSKLREAGYYVTNNAKEDYNIDVSQTRDIWNESNGQAHYKNRTDGRSFFAVFNNSQSHENNIHKWKSLEELRHSPDEVTVPPYLPDTSEIRRDLAQYYDHVEDMDQWIGQKLQELEESGEAENTIIFYYGDHGGVYPRSKRFVYETGTRVPLIVHIPDKYKHLWPKERTGTDIDRLVSFVDLAPTILSLTDIEIPEFMQGDAFLGGQKTADPEYTFMFRDRMDERYDMSRAARNNRFRYIRNYTPHRIYGQPIEYLWRAMAMQSWEKICIEGGCNKTQQLFWNPKPVEELYDTQNDPWEVNNLAENPDYKNVLVEMRKATKTWVLDIKDTGFLPEAELLSLSAEDSAYEYMRSGDVDLEPIIEAAEAAVSISEKNMDELISNLYSENRTIRFWGATGLLIRGEEAKNYSDELKRALNDESPYVVTVSAEALYNIGEKETAFKGFKSVLKNPNSLVRTFALNAITSAIEDSDEFKDIVIQMVKDHGTMSYSNYDHRIVRMLFAEWDISAEELGVETDETMF